MTLLIVFVMAFHSYPCKPVFTKYAKSCVFWEVRECTDKHGIALATGAETVCVQYSHTADVRKTTPSSAEEARSSRILLRWQMM